jgi:glycosyltransferase involved in cell wall biosynthesis
MRVGFDATSLLGRQTGIGVCTKAMLTRLQRPGLDVVAYAVSARGSRSLRSLVPDEVDVVRRPMAARPLRAAWRRSDHPVLERWTGPIDVAHGPNFVVPPTRNSAEVVTVHDLTCIRFPEMCTSDTLQIPTLLRRAIARGAWVHAVSQFVADEVISTFAIDADRVRVVHNGAPEVRSDDERSELAAAGRSLAGSDHYLLSLGTIEPRKDVPGLISAFERLAAHDADLRLIIAGPDGWGADAVTASIAGSAFSSRITRTGWIDERHRDALLAGAAAFVYPSVYEGFGLPPLEAMALGTPVVATRAGALPEILGDTVSWAEPTDPDSLAAAISDLLTHRDAAQHRTEQGELRLARFDWNRTVDSLVTLYSDAIADH